MLELVTRVRVGMVLVVLVVVLVLVATIFDDGDVVAVLIATESDDSDSVVVVLVVVSLGNLLLHVLRRRIFGGWRIFGGSFAGVSAGHVLSFLCRCNCQRGVGGAMVMAVSFFFGGIVVDDVVQGRIFVVTGEGLSAVHVLQVRLKNG